MKNETPVRRGLEDAPRWYLLIHQLPPKPLYLRAKIRQRLSRVGAVALKKSVYVLPHRNDCLEDFEWIAQEAASGGGEAYVCAASFADPRTDEALVARFRRERDADYEALAAAIGESGRRAGRRTGARLVGEDLPAEIARARRRLEEIARIDFFESAGRPAAEDALRQVERRSKSGQRRLRGAAPKGLRRRTWVTRRGVQVDRIASAWLIRRFIDPRARFRFVEPKEPARVGELRFDMIGGDFSHEGDRCTLETLIAQTGIEDPALGPLAEIVHDIDLKDGKFHRPETAGVEQLLWGLLATSPRDEKRLERGFALFDGLYESFRRRLLEKEVRP